MADANELDAFSESSAENEPGTPAGCTHSDSRPVDSRISKRPWWRTPLWVGSLECSNLCMVIAALKQRHPIASSLIKVMVNDVSTFLRPPRILAVGSAPMVPSKGGNNLLRFFEADTGKECGHIMDEPNTAVRCLAFAPDGTHLAVANDDGSLHLIDHETCAYLRSFKIDVTCLAYTPDSSCLHAACRNGHVCSIDPRTMLQTAACRVANGDIKNMLVAISSVGSVAIDVNVAHHRQHLMISSGTNNALMWRHRISMACQVFSPSGSRLVMGDCHGAIHLVNSQTCLELWTQKLAPCPEHGGLSEVNVEYSACEQHLFAADSCGTFHVLDAESGAKLKQWQCYKGMAPCLAYSSHDGTLACVDGGLGWHKAWPRTREEKESLQSRVRIFNANADGAQMLSCMYRISCGENLDPTVSRPCCGGIPKAVAFAPPPNLFPEARVQQSTHTQEVALEPVIQSIVHDEPPASRETELIQLQADVQWAEHVENRIEAEAMHEKLQRVRLSDSSHPAASWEEESTPAVDIWLLTYKSHPREFYDALVEGAPLRACHAALAEINRHCVLPDSGAKVFIEPEHWDVVMSNLEGRALHPYHVVVSADNERLVEESLLAIPNRKRPKLKNASGGRELLINGNGMPLSGDDCDGLDVFQELDASAATWTPNRTFLCSVRGLRNQDSVVQSTVEHYGAVPNPRRHIT